MIRPKRFVCIAMLSCLAMGCGYKTNPRPAAASFPAEIAVIDASAYPEYISLRWSRPARNTDGSAFTDISGFKVYRAVRKIGEECEVCDEKRTVLHNIDVQSPVEAVIGKDDIVYKDTSVSTGNVYTYWVTAYNLKGREGKPGPETVVFLENLPAPPQGLTAVSESEGVVRLQWRAGTGGPSIHGWRIYRGVSSDPSTMTLLGGRNTDETTYYDKKAEIGRKFHYVVRAFRMNRSVSMESAPAIAAAVAEANGPLEPPTEVNAERGTDGIEITWAPQGEGQDITYNVWRSESGRVFVKINPEPLTEARFSDKYVRRGATYHYAVTALKQGKESARSSVVVMEFRGLRSG